MGFDQIPGGKKEFVYFVVNNEKKKKKKKKKKGGGGGGGWRGGRMGMGRGKVFFQGTFHICSKLTMSFVNVSLKL